MNTGMLVLVGCVLGTGALVYHGTMAGSVPAHSASTEAAATTGSHAAVVVEPTVLARAGAPSPTPSPAAPPKLTLDQVRSIARPASTPVPLGAQTRPGPRPLNPALPTSPPQVAPPTSVPPGPESGIPSSSPTPQPSVGPTATATPGVTSIATPPAFPPPPERPAPVPMPTEQPR